MIVIHCNIAVLTKMVYHVKTNDVISLIDYIISDPNINRNYTDVWINSSLMKRLCKDFLKPNDEIIHRSLSNKMKFLANSTVHPLHHKSVWNNKDRVSIF